MEKDVHDHGPVRGLLWVEMEITAIMAPEESRLGRTIQNQNAPRMGCRMGRNGNNRHHGSGGVSSG